MKSSQVPEELYPSPTQRTLLWGIIAVSLGGMIHFVMRDVDKGQIRWLSSVILPICVIAGARLRLGAPKLPPQFLRMIEVVVTVIPIAIVLGDMFDLF